MGWHSFKNTKINKYKNMFILSEILQQMNYGGKYEIINEKSFKYLALTASDLHDLNCVFLDNKKFISTLSNYVSMILTTDDVASSIDDTLYGVCIVEKPRELFFRIHNFLCDNSDYSHPKSKTTIGENCNISKHTVVAEHNVTIGNNVTIEEFSVIKENTKIGDDTIIRAGSIIGGTGFEFKRINNGILSVKHVGGVVIGNNVEIQYNTCVDKGIYPWDNTLVGDYCKIDNLVQIAHGVKLGKNVMIAANSSIAGRTIIGENSWIGVGVTITNGIKIGEESRINIGSVLLKSIKPKGSVLGNPAYEKEKFGKIQYELNELIKNK